ncbi:T9SS type A sorting domain-containing protein [Fibrella sp. HMF5335]|uniref:T9SS type A sorting domain-containing protein n=1 Tax=Fibrella rubiginis TaxID=2817060 RepID=A0A939K6X9_9BACT|nr:T9SS type A sorting domain-containing protein [Fibrella rubiginis]MBO0938035.1 T9SS type A sorting domain-containing protein [Fibrella rubiginis]
MNASSILYLLFFSVGLISQVQAQTQVAFPITRAVFQRSNANSASVPITGTYSIPVTRIEARVVARTNGQGFTTDFQTIVDNPQGGVFNAQLTVQGGWYDLIVRFMRGNDEVARQTVERVGVGEVFVIAGQSNAQGIRGETEPALDDRVNAVNYDYQPEQYPADAPYPVFSQLNGNNRIAPRGFSSWCWGNLGDLLAQRLNVPILFFNAAFLGTSVRNWAESSQGKPTLSDYIPAYYQRGQPYASLQIALTSYVSLVGMRAILWHQGETDNAFSTSRSQYADRLNTLVKQSRINSGKNLSWVVARASYDDALKSNPNIIGAQNDVIAAGNGVYAGPNTEAIQIPRARPPYNDPIHFDNGGLRELAAAWNTSLTDALLSSITPVTPSPVPIVTVSCPGGNAVNFTVTNYDNVTWESGENGKSITKTSGQVVRAKVKDPLGYVHYTPYLTVSNAPIIQTNGAAAFCQGGSVQLTSSYPVNNTWSTGSTEPSISVNTTGDYSVSYKDVSGCTFKSNTVKVTSNPIPAAPSVSAEKATTFCQGDNTVLASSPAAAYEWSNGERTQKITVGQAGNYSLRITDANGCTSPTSSTVGVTVNPLPAPPQLTASGKTTFCANESVTLTASQEASYEWSNGQTTRSINVSTAGTYSVRTRNSFNCLSNPSNSAVVVVNALPAAPSVNAEKATTFCQGDNTVLASSPAAAYEWSNGERTQKITVGQAGNYSLRITDANGCTSPTSSTVGVTVNPLPAPPQLTASGKTTFCANESVTLTASQEASYEWSNGQTTRSINVSTAGTYSVRTRNSFNCLSALSNTVNVVVNPLPSPPTISTKGSLIFCEGDFVTLQSSSPFRTLWSTGDSTQTLIVRQGGTYSARTRDNNGCLSTNSGLILTATRARPAAPTLQQVGTFLLQASGAPANERYYWRRGQDSLMVSTAQIRVTQAGQYTVRTANTYSSALVCLSLPSAPYDFVLPANGETLSIYPNPSLDGNFLIETLEDLSNAVIVIYTLSGQQVYQTDATTLGERKQLQLYMLAPGPYILQLQATGLKTSKRIQIGQ